MDLTNSLYNVDCLNLLERLPSKSVDLVYLDPPWADFWREGNERKADYLFFLSERLQHIHRILKDTGNLFFHINPEDSHKIRLLIDFYFGEKNFRGQYILPYPRIRVDVGRNPYLNYSAILFYGKTSESTYNPPIRSYKSDEVNERYPYTDERGRFRLISLITPLDRPSLRFEWNGVTPPAGRSWRYSRERLDQLQKENLVSLGISNKIPSIKEYFDAENAVPVASVWDDLNYFIPQNERTGFVAQQSIELLSRVIAIGSNPNDIVLDPFCGSGTTLVAASMLNRIWIGCDITPEVYDLVLERMIATTRDSASSFSKGNWAKLEQDHPRVYKLAEPNFEILIRIAKEQSPHSQNFPESQEEVSSKEQNDHSEVKKQEYIRPLVLTEGKTDWKHLKSAFHKLRESGYLSEGIDIEFHEEEADTGYGDAELLTMCRQFSKTKQPRKHIFIFDRDKDDIVKAVSANGKPYKDWGNNVFSFAIPVPSHRISQPKISIEFYYYDNDLRRTDPSGRRLFLSSEFHTTSGRHITEDLNCSEINRVRGEVKIIDSQVFDKQNRNVALSKNNFAEHILKGERNFRDVDIQEFVKIFEVIEQIFRENS